jgi:Type II secretion system (T2SS), protein M subtype b
VKLSKREKYVGLGVGIAVSLWILDSVLLTPYLAERDTVATQLTAANQKLSDANVLFARRQHLEKIWQEMQKGGLKSDQAEADQQAQHAVLDWFDRSGVFLVALKSDPHVSEEGKFQVIKYHMQGEGALRQIARLLWAMETATIPVRVDELTIKPQGREGTEPLSIELGISTLSITPAPNQTGGNAVSVAEFGRELP